MISPREELAQRENMRRKIEDALEYIFASDKELSKYICLGRIDKITSMAKGGESKMEECECKNWARTDSRLAKHHPSCSRYDIEGDVIELITALVRGIELWASDEDGVHDDCWEAYRRAKFCIGEYIKGEDNLTWPARRTE
ncbi:MAG: hypothetical protein ABH868_04500 [bacterium]